MKRVTLSIIFLLLIKISALAQTDQDLIKETIYNFIDGTTYNYPDTIASAFYPGTRMFLHNDQDSTWIMTSEQYAALFGRRPPGTKNNRIGSITTIDIEKDVAFAKLQFIIPFFGNRYYDLL